MGQSDLKKISDRIKEDALKEIASKEIEISCPGCNTSFKAHPGSNVCPNCGASISLDIEIK